MKKFEISTVEEKHQISGDYFRIEDGFLFIERFNDSRSAVFSVWEYVKEV